MRSKNIVRYPDPRLRFPCKHVQVVDDSVRGLINHLAVAFAESRGFGLAANQIGATKRVIIYDEHRGDWNVNWTAIVNPRIVAAIGQQVSEHESCESFPGLYVDVPRAGHIRVEGLDPTGRKIIVEASGNEAAVIQHQVDLLDGILIVDRVPPERRQCTIGYADHLVEVNKRLEWLVSKPDGKLLLARSSCNGILIVKEGFQVHMYFVDQTVFQNRRLFLKEFAQGTSRSVSGIMSRIDLSAPVNLLSVYTQVMMLTLTWVSSPKRVYMLGFGGGRIPLVLRHHFPNIIIEGSELDPSVVDIAREYFGIAFDERMTVTVGDGRTHLSNLSESVKYDIFLIDCFSGLGNHPDELATPEFYSLCKAKLAMGGIVATNLIDSDEQFHLKYESFRQSFNFAYECVYADAYILFGTDTGGISPDDLVSRAETLDHEHGFQFRLTPLARRIVPLHPKELASACQTGSKYNDESSRIFTNQIQLEGKVSTIETRLEDPEK